jgi:molybdopterin-guanine dinucleotide biosynthesis protein
VRFANVTAFVVLKALAFDQRAENKDAADLIHVLRYANAGNVEVAVQEFVRYHRAKDNQDVLDKTLAILHRRFCDGVGIEGYLRDGPKACAVFTYGRDAGLEEERVLEQRNVSGLVSFFVEKVRENISDPQWEQAFS